MPYIILAHLTKNKGGTRVDTAQVCYATFEHTKALQALHENSFDFIVLSHDLTIDSETFESLRAFLADAKKLGVLDNAIDVVKRHGTKDQIQAICNHQFAMNSWLNG